MSALPPDDLDEYLDGLEAADREEGRDREQRRLYDEASKLGDGRTPDGAALFDSPEHEAEVKAKLATFGVSLLTIPAPTGEALHRLEGWRDNIERYGQDLWAIYHWIVKAQDGHTHGVYALAQWLEHWGVPDNTTKSGDYEEVFHARRSVSE